MNDHSNEPGGYAVVLSATRDRGGIYDALSHRATYATSGVRAWLDYAIDGQPMGTQMSSSSAQAMASITLLAGMNITTLQLWTVQVGGAAGSYTTARRREPISTPPRCPSPIPFRPAAARRNGCTTSAHF